MKNHSVFRRYVGCWVGLGLAVGSSGLGAVAAEPERGFTVVAVESRAAAIEVTLALQQPAVRTNAARNGAVYSRLVLPGCGNDNAHGRPALPLVSHTLEVPRGSHVTVTVAEQNLREFGVALPVQPHQPPVAKDGRRLDEVPFVVDPAYYTGAKSAAFETSGASPEVHPFTQRGRDYVNVILRPFRYNAKAGAVRFPEKLTLQLRLDKPLPKAAGPRKGTIFVVEVTIDGRAQLDRLVEDGYDIDGVKGSTVRIYATEAEVEALRQAGFAPKELERQPRAPRPPAGPESKGFDQYHSYTGLTAELSRYAADFPTLCRLQSIGQSVRGRELWALKITANPDVQEDEPKVKYVGAIHGDESLGSEMCLRFIDALLTGYPTNARAAALVDHAEVWVLPVMNPDGLDLGTRYNADGYDLNRSFPEGSSDPIGNVLDGPPMDSARRPTEVARMMEWSATNRFVLSANFHTGSFVVNYPYDNDGLGSVFSPTPDEPLFRVMALAYASNNAPLYANSDPPFVNGIVNGAAWYAVVGGMQDWHYRYLGCNEVTIELSYDFQPPETQLARLWTDNRNAMFAYLETVQHGVRGAVVDNGTGQPLFASVTPVGIDQPVFTDPVDGRYHRMLLAGTYDLVFSAPGYLSRTVPGVVVSNGVARADARLDPAVPQTNGLIAVSHTSTRNGALAFAAQKQAQGFEVTEIVLTNAPTAEEVRARVREVYDATHAQYVVLLGDLRQVPTFYNGAASDLPYGLMDPGEGFGDYLGKDLVVGRISLESDAALFNYTNKVAGFLAATRAKGTFDMTWVSGGNSDSEFDIAEGTHDWVIGNCIPADYHHELFYRDNGSAAELTAHINEGTDGVFYSGHGGEFTWVRYNYGIAELANLHNAPDVPIVIGHCCVAGSFNEDTCFGEAWLETVDRGIVYVGASDNTYWDEDDVMERYEFLAMSTNWNLPIGAAVDSGLLEVHNQYPSSAEYYYTIYHTFGDPTVTLFGGLSFRIVTPTNLPMAYAGQAYATTLQAGGGVEPYTWGVAAGGLPAGFSLNATNGVLSGTTSNAGIWEFTVQVTDAAAGVTNRPFMLAVAVPPPPPGVFRAFSLETSPAWLVGAGWAFGVPLGLGSQNHDPSSGYTGSNVYGYNLLGDYANNLAPTYLTAGPIDCAGYDGLVLGFRRWLGVEAGDSATVEVSRDGVRWNTAWSATKAVRDAQWEPVTLDLAPYTDGAAVLYVRWGMGPTDRSGTGPGWNLDDITLTGQMMLALRGTPLWWLIANGLTNQPPDVAEMMDSDGDGALNWQECGAHTAPTNAASVFAIGACALGTNGSMSVHFATIAGLLYRLEGATNLVAGPWAPAAYSTSPGGALVTDPIPGQGGPVTVYVVPSETAEFYLLRVLE